ncbi:MAG: hypothetical protein E6J55_17465 [Deltaproteobacteria bacterium]|nr:MAG: hypothetical protein E6J55_17465 [Deltaproteobacteria bacterium]
MYATAMRLPRAVILAVGIAIATPAGAQLAQPVEGVWHLTGHVVATGCGGRCVTRRETVDQEVVIANGQLSGAEGLVPACEGGLSEQEFDGLFTVVPGRRGWFNIRVADRARFRDLVRRCIGYPSLRLGRFGGRLRVAVDGRSFDEVVHVAGSVSVLGRTATFSARGRVHGDRVRDAAAPFAPFTTAAVARALDAALAAE